MELKDALLKRRSIRKFKEDKISDEIINELLVAGMSGASACNRCPWEFYVITNEEMMEKVKKITRWGHYDSPLAIIVCGNKNKALPLQLSDFWIQDCSIATTNIQLRAVDLGLGSVWCGILPQKNPMKRASEVLELPNHIIPLSLLFIGYPNEEKEERSQFDEKKVHYIK